MSSHEKESIDGAEDFDSGASDQELSRGAVEGHEDFTLEESVQIRKEMYDYALSHLDDSNPKLAETILYFLRMERDRQINLLPKGHPDRRLIEADEEGEQ